jgi:hypothetical protein
MLVRVARRRSVTWLARLVPILAIVGALTAAATGQRMLLQPLVLMAVMLAPALMPRNVLYPPPPPPPSGADDDDGGGRGPRRLPKAPDGPGGGVPLSDADPARVRIRDHRRPALVRSRPRRAGQESAHAPARTPHGATPD